MHYKILTVDDSKVVRIIVRKTFRSFDCEIFEAVNGVEGLALAAKTVPDLILLDITMPVMDGVEMLTRIKADPQLKGIPVMMLTAEGGRDNVLKIAKLGVRDYIVKPFTEATLVEKANRIIDLKPVTESVDRKKSTLDRADILVVEDKPAIIQQLTEGLRHTPWKIQGVANQAEAMEQCSRLTPDLIMINLTLPDESAFTLFRYLRTNPRTMFTPVFGLVVKTDTAVQNHAQQIGFSSIVTKPIDVVELEARMAKAMNLDTSMRYFRLEAGHLIISLPEICTPAVLGEVGQYLQPKLTEAVNAGLNRVVIDIHAVRCLEMNTFKLLFPMMQACRDLGMNYSLVGNPQVITECRGVEETKTWVFHATLDEAKAHLAGEGAATALPELVET